MTDHRVSRGRATQEMVAARLRALGLIHARSRAASLPGADIEDVPGLYIEVKAKAEARVGSWARDNAAKAREATSTGPDDPGALPFVVFRPNGYGPAAIDDWPVILRFTDAARLLQAGGWLPPTEGNPT